MLNHDEVWDLRAQKNLSHRPVISGALRTRGRPSATDWWGVLAGHPINFPTILCSLWRLITSEIDPEKQTEARLFDVAWTFVFLLMAACIFLVKWDGFFGWVVENSVIACSCEEFLRKERCPWCSSSPWQTGPVARNPSRSRLWVKAGMVKDSIQ